MTPFVDWSWVGQHRHQVRLADVRWYLDGRSGADAHAAGHAPGAVFVDLARWLAAPASDAAGRHPLPAPAVFAAGMAACGIGDGDVVVAHDDAGGVIAARLVWMLRALGEQAALVDGGLLAYDGPLTTDVTPVRTASFTARPWPQDLLAGMDELTTPGVAVLDARPRSRFEGEPDDLDPRPGHIPGSRSVPCRESVDERGLLLEPATLRQRFLAAGAGPDADVVSSCGSGVTACHNLLVREQVGLGRGRLYPGSWSQWSRSDRPVER